MAFYEKWFGKGRIVARARTAELRGDLHEASSLFAEAGEVDEAARILLARGDGESEPRSRLLFFTQAGKLSRPGTPANVEARSKRAELLLALAGDVEASAIARHEVIAAAKDLEEIGAHARAAEAFARAGDREGEARALQSAGDVDALEHLLSMQQHAERASRSRENEARNVEVLVECGRRREAFAELEKLIARGSVDVTALRDRWNGIHVRRALGPIVSVRARSSSGELEPYSLVTGDEVVIGRTEGSIRIPSSAVSRRHLVLSRDREAVVVRDLGSRNGTQLRGINLAGSLVVGDGLEVTLGKEVKLRLSPSARIEGAIAIEIAGETYHAGLGPVRTPSPGLALVMGADDWIELASGSVPVYAGEIELAPRPTLLVGDALATTRGGARVLEILGATNR